MASRGDDLFAKAEKKAKSSTGWFSSSSSKWEDAGDLFQQVSGGPRRRRRGGGGRGGASTARPTSQSQKQTLLTQTQAGNAYKVDGRWTESGKAFEREADCRLQAGEKNDAMNAFHNAAKSYKKNDPAGE